MKMRRFLLVVTMYLLLVGCSDSTDTVTKPTNDNENEREEAKDQNEEVIPPAATDPDDIFMQNPGILMVDGEYSEDELKQTLQSMPDNLSEQEIFDHLVFYLAQDYQSTYQELQAFDPSNQPNLKTPDGEIKLPVMDHVNVFVLLDASGSMAGKVRGGVMMDLAKSAIQDFTKELPDDAHVSLRVYGHKGSNHEKDRDVSCDSNEEVYALSPYDQDQFSKSLDQFGPTGWTPLAAAISETTAAVKETDVNTRNIVYVVSDGEETCGGNPVQAAKELNEAGAQTVINILGFNVDNKGKKQLMEMAKVSNGNYKHVLSGSDLDSYLKAEQKRIEREWRLWSTKSKFEADKNWAQNYQKLSELVYNNGLTGLALEESKQLQHGADILNDMGKVGDIIELRSMIHNRENSLRKRALQFDKTISQRLREERSRAKSEIEEKRNENTGSNEN
ncbi:hypothetical protein CEN49_21740 [Fischerella thermalis CCMEE 5273]|nr:hypothetical protein CEN49_21740 [Fischerella thermalis CCMEE 5273]